MSRPATERPPRELVEPLERALGWLLSLRDGEGRILCPDHRIEHTGKSACAAILALELHRATGDPALLDAAVQQGRRLVARLEREGTSPCFTFRPGRHDPFNCSNSVIDGGACSDALASIVLARGDALDPADREVFAEASARHARTYLRYAVLDKGVPAQRAWGLTGLAAAWAVTRDAELERAAVEAVGVLEGVQHADGSFPYHPLEWGAEHPGASDVSCFYQSRVTGFVLHALETLGRDPNSELFRRPLRRGLDFLAALQGPDGVKPGLVEAKPWYWGAPYEVASHPFDVHALARGFEVYGRQEYGVGALRAHRAWADHLGPEGRPASHRPGPGRGESYQCATFWAAHACWAARALGALTAARARHGEALDRGDTTGLDLQLLWFPNAQLGRLEDGRVVAWVRGARPAVDVHHGSPHGAGLVRVVRRGDGAELLPRCRLGGHQQGEWSGLAGHASPARGWRSGREALRFSLWLSRVAARRHGPLAAFGPPAETLRRGVLAFGHPRVSSAFALAPDVRDVADGFDVDGPLAWRDGTPVPGSRVERRFRVDGAGLEVAERLVSAGAARRVAYRIPDAATAVERSGDRVRYRLA